MAEFDIIRYIDGLTNFVFDKTQLQRIALDCGVAEVTAYDELTDEQKDKCIIEIYKLVVYGPYSTASVKTKHGDYELTVGSQTITSTQMEAIKSRLRALLKKYNMDEDSEALSDASGEMDWIHEFH